MRKGIVMVLSAYLVVSVGVGCFLWGKRSVMPAPVVEKVDTLVVRDTIMSEKPIYVDRRVVEKVFVPVVDTLEMRDTLFVVLDREQVVWEDSLACVYASGIMPKVDSVRHYATTKVITIEKAVRVKEKSRWGAGIQCGMVTTIKDGRVVASPGISVGVSYNLLSW